MIPQVSDKYYKQQKEMDQFQASLPDQTFLNFDKFRTPFVAVQSNYPEIDKRPAIRIYFGKTTDNYLFFDKTPLDRSSSESQGAIKKYMETMETFDDFHRASIDDPNNDLSEMIDERITIGYNEKLGTMISLGNQHNQYVYKISEQYFIGELADIRYLFTDFEEEIEEIFHIIKLDQDREMNYTLLVQWTSEHFSQLSYLQLASLSFIADFYHMPLYEACLQSITRWPQEDGDFASLYTWDLMEAYGLDPILEQIEARQNKYFIESTMFLLLDFLREPDQSFDPNDNLSIDDLPQKIERAICKLLLEKEDLLAEFIKEIDQHYFDFPFWLINYITLPTRGRKLAESSNINELRKIYQRIADGRPIEINEEDDVAIIRMRLQVD